MIHSMEVRWFFEEPPFAVADLFPESQTAVTRTDWYLAGTSDGCGIKIRSGSRMETRLRSATPGIHEWGPASGQLEAWNKWSLPFESHETPHEQLLAENHWIPVTKNRHLRIFSIHDEKLTEQSLSSGRIDNGCLFEMTSMTVKGNEYWTIGFEAFGDYDQLTNNLLLTTNHLFKLMPAEGFNADISYAYPHWLRRFI